MTTITRTYTHKTFGTIGTAELILPEGPFYLNGAELPVEAVRHLGNFALQTFQDAYAGAKSADEAKANFDKKMTKVTEGSIGVRDGSSAAPRDPIAAEALRIGWTILRSKGADAIKTACTALVSGGKAEDEKAAKRLLAKAFADLPSTIEAAKANVERAKAAAETGAIDVASLFAE